MSIVEYVNFRDLNIWSLHLLLSSNKIYKDTYPIVPFKEFAKKATIHKVHIKDNESYKILGVRTYGKGVYLNREVLGSTLKMKIYQKAKVNHLYWCKVDTKNGAFGIVSNEFKDGIGSSNMTFAELDTSKIYLPYLELFFKSKKFNNYMDSLVVGTTNRKYIKFNDLLNDVKIPLPASLDEQRKIAKAYQTKIDIANRQEEELKGKEKGIEEFLYDRLKIVKNTKVENELLRFTYFNNLSSWSYKDIFDGIKIESLEYDVVKLSQKPTLYLDAFRGKSPKYDTNHEFFILNQKCIRWNYIESKYAKSVKKEWFLKIDQKFFTREGDILINSTGDGTIGRAALVTKDFENLIYDSHILLLRVNPKEINPSYLVEYINSQLGQLQIENIKSAVATKQTELGLGNLKNIKIVLPKIAIQNTIADHIKQEKEDISNLKEQAEKNRLLALEEFEREIFDEA